MEKLIQLSSLKNSTAKENQSYEKNGVFDSYVIVELTAIPT